LVAVSGLTAADPAPRVERDLAYGADPKQKLDLSVPATKGFTTVLFVHGGSLTGGDKRDEDYGKVCAPFVAAGIGCANANYRLAPQHMWPAPAEDVAAAVAWLKKEIPARGGDPSRLFLFGHSSGATLVALVGSDPKYLAHHKLGLRDVHGVIPMGSIMWDVQLEDALAQHGRARVEEAFQRRTDDRMFASLEVYEDHWPIHHVQKGLPSFLFLVAEEEQENPPVLSTNRKFVEEARALGNRADYRVLPGKTHYSAIRGLGAVGDAGFASIRDFLAR
jgi:acetyl esterase/lipase